jgi:hypothetical protein
MSRSCGSGNHRAQCECIVRWQMLGNMILPPQTHHIPHSCAAAPVSLIHEASYFHLTRNQTPNKSGPVFAVTMAAPYGGVAEKIRRAGSDDDINSDADEEYEVWIPDTTSKKVTDRMQPCKACGTEFKFFVAPGQKLSQSATVREFYDHCLNNCTEYEELGEFVVRICSLNRLTDFLFCFLFLFM